MQKITFNVRCMKEIKDIEIRHFSVSIIIKLLNCIFYQSYLRMAVAKYLTSINSFMTEADII